ncbi:MAG: PadR family transcriptional regulator, partial [Methanoregula sp.]|nr:PadR family transcriptional regulator [Methanoregula sp.]
AAIEVALFRKTAESEEQKRKKTEKISPGQELHGSEEGIAYLDLPEVKTVLLKDILTDIVLFLYTDQVAKEPIFKFALEEGIKKGGRNLFAYSHSTLPRYFPKEIQKGELHTHRIKKDEVFTLLPLLEKCTASLQSQAATSSLQILLDFSETDSFSDILAIRKLLLQKKESKVPVFGIIAVNMEKIDHTLIQSLAEGIPKIIVSTGKTTTLSFAHHTFSSGSVVVVPQSTIDDVVKKLLEPVVLALLTKPISGYDIVHEIHNRYNVLIPQARVYTLLYELLEDGYLEIQVSGKSKLYCPTEKGKKHFIQKLNDFKQVFEHIIGNVKEINPGCNDKK